MSAASPPQPVTPQETTRHERHVQRALDREEPTRTKTIRQDYAQRLRGRWDAIETAMRTGLVEHDALGLQTEALVDAPARNQFDFATEPRQVEAFDRWLQRQVDREILQEFGQDNQYIQRAYERGVKDATAELRTLGLAGEGDVVATAMQLPVHRDQLEALYARNLSALEGMSDATANQMRRVLSEGLAAGDGPQDIARDLAGRIDAVGRTRANMIARSEIMHSHNRARAAEWERAGVKKADILIADTACAECQALAAGAPYDVQEAKGLLPRHPNCRCSLSIYTE